jgi:uncharacterized SAM-binding protein YcdF (DUF218 family)
MDLLTTKTLSLLLLPPGVLVLIALLGFLIQVKWRWAGIAIIGLSVAVLFVLSTAHTGRQLLAAIEAPYKALPLTLTPDQARAQAEAIVVLGGGRYIAAPEYGGDTVDRFTLERLRYAARLQRQTGLPILVSGGSYDGGRAEAELMREVLEKDFGATVKWVEARSRTTHENAVNSKQTLSEAGIRRVYLVTHAWHMARAEWAFVQSGILVTPAPTGFTTPAPDDYRQLGYLPTGRGLYLSSQALHERLGLFWYKSSYQAEQVLPEKQKKPATAN